MGTLIVARRTLSCLASAQGTSHVFSAIVAGSLTLSVLSVVCVSVSFGRSSFVTRERTTSRLYETAEIFYPGGVFHSAVVVSDLAPAQMRILAESIESVMDDLWSVNTRQAAHLSKACDRSINRRVRPTLELTDASRAQANIDAAGRLRLDAKVVWAMFLAATVSAFEADIIFANELPLWWRQRW